MIRNNDGLAKLALPSDQDASGRQFAGEELRNVAAALESGTLTSTKGNFVKDLEGEFAEILSAKAAFACTSGTAALHTAVAAIDPEPGDEIITTPITDMGALAPILYQAPCVRGCGPANLQFDGGNHPNPYYFADPGHHGDSSFW